MAVHTFAAIDIGSYDVTLEIFEISRKNGIHSIDRIRQRLELGRDTFANGLIGPQMLDRLCDILSDFVEIIKSYKVDNYRVIATSAIREAENDLFIRGKIKTKTGLDVEILSNSEQRFLSYKAIASIHNRFNKLIKNGTAIVDLDGGSIQISLFDNEALVTTQNMRMGNLRLRELIEPLSRETVDYERLVEELIQYDIVSFKQMYLKGHKIENVIISGDFITEIIFKNQHNREERVLTRQEFENWYGSLVGKSVAELAMNLGIPNEYASLLRPSVIIYHRMVQEMDASTIWTPGTHLSRGLAYEYAEKQKFLKYSHNFENDILSATQQIARRYAVGKKHIENCDMTAMAIFDATKSIHGMGHRDRLLLEVAVMLHDCGKYISYSRIGESSYNIIMSNEIIGLSHAERKIVALCARYVDSYLPGYTNLVEKSNITKESYLKMAYFTAIIRYANALDRSHMQKIKDVRASLKEDELIVRIKVKGDFILENGLIEPKASFFQEVFGVKPVLKVKTIV